jgi:hypothetical protein
MKSESFFTKEGERMEHIKRLADEAEKQAKLLDLKISPSLHITKALQGIPEGRERDLLFGEIRKELKRREEKRKRDQKDLQEALSQLDKNKKQEQMRDAWRHQIKQPRDTWDPTFDDQEEES